ncbi:hypothetical protein Dimus_003602, partial [Dionaea muscipula]
MPAARRRIDDSGQPLVFATAGLRRLWRAFGERGQPHMAASIAATGRGSAQRIAVAASAARCADSHGRFAAAPAEQKARRAASEGSHNSTRAVADSHATAALSATAALHPAQQQRWR